MTGDGTEVIADDVRSNRRGQWGVLSIAVAIVFGLFFAYDLFEAISNVAVLPGDIALENKVRATVGLAARGVPWTLLIADLVVSPVVYGLAFFLGRRHPVAIKAVYFAVGLAAVAAASLSLVALA